MSKRENTRQKLSVANLALCGIRGMRRTHAELQAVGGASVAARHHFWFGRCEQKGCCL